MREYAAIKIGEDDLFLALWQMASEQEVDNWSGETQKKFDDLNERFDVLERGMQVELSNNCSDLRNHLPSKQRT